MTDVIDRLSMGYVVMRRFDETGEPPHDTPYGPTVYESESESMLEDDVAWACNFRLDILDAPHGGLRT